MQHFGAAPQRLCVRQQLVAVAVAVAVPGKRELYAAVLGSRYSRSLDEGRSVNKLKLNSIRDGTRSLVM